MYFSSVGLNASVESAGLMQIFGFFVVGFFFYFPLSTFKVGELCWGPFNVFLMPLLLMTFPLSLPLPTVGQLVCLFIGGTISFTSTSILSFKKGFG